MEGHNKVMVGIFVAGGVLLFAIGLFLIGDRRQLFNKSINLNAEFQRISGLQTGAPVRVSGSNAGEVTDIIVPPGPQAKFRVTFRVVDKYQSVLRIDSVATILTDGLVGNKFLEVGAGSEQGKKVEDGDTIESREPFDISDLMQEVSDTVHKVNDSVDDVQRDVQKTLRSATNVVDHTDKLIVSVSDDVQNTVASSSQIAGHVRNLIGRVDRGEGTVGRLFNDDRLYQNLEKTTRNVEQSTFNIRKTTDHVQDLVNDFKSRDIIGDLKQTTANVKDVTARARQAVQDFQPDQGEGLAADLRQTLAHADETMTDFSENAEALKHNWFFRGFFKKRRFYDLDEINVADYKAGRQAPGWPVERAWLPAGELFLMKPDGAEQLTRAGKRVIDRAMAPIIDRARTHPIIVEGYASQGSTTQQFTHSNERAKAVRDYLIKTFLLRSNYVGLMQMGAVPSTAGDSEYWEGVAVVLFTNKPPGRQESEVEFVAPAKKGTGTANTVSPAATGP